MSCGVELHNKLIIPLCELLPNKVLYSTRLETIIDSWIVLFILPDVLPVHPSHITDYRLLDKQHCLIEVLLFLCMEPVVQNSSSPDCIGISQSPLSKSCNLHELHVLSYWMSIIVIWNFGLQLPQDM